MYHLMFICYNKSLYNYTEAQNMILFNLLLSIYKDMIEKILFFGFVCFINRLIYLQTANVRKCDLRLMKKTTRTADKVSKRLMDKLNR